MKKEESLAPHLMECKTSDSPSSSTDSCSGQPPPAALSTASSGCRPAIRGDLSTDLHLGLSLSCSSIQTDNSTPSTPRSALTTTTATAMAKTAAAYQRGSGGHGQRSLFVKVYMEGVPIGRKLDLLLLDGYDGLLAQLGRMFKASITYPDVMGGHQVVLGEKQQQARHVLTYEDQEGDWMMVGDVPWELFLTSVKKLRIARADKCFIK